MPEVRPNTLSSDVVFFFGAGASAPFGIPTMKQFVIDFEKHLDDNASKDERILYADIRGTLEERLGKKVDLEAVFTVIDGIIDYSPERHDLLSLYAVSEFKKPFPPKQDIPICKLLREKFQTFVKEKCVIPDESFDKIRNVYQDFFNRFALELPPRNLGSNDDYAYDRDWAIFTTNYDMCLEHYWRHVVGVGIDTGFISDDARAIRVLRSDMFLNTTGNVLRLVKLHGSYSNSLRFNTNK